MLHICKVRSKDGFGVTVAARSLSQLVFATSGRFSSLSLAARQVLAMSLEQVFMVTFGVGVAMLIVTLFLKDVRLRKRGEGMPTNESKKG